MNQLGVTNTVTTLDSSSQENHQTLNANQHHAPSYYVPPNSTAVAWSAHGSDIYAKENGVPTQSGYDHGQQAAPPSRNVQDGVNGAMGATSANVQQDYNSYATYQSTDPYSYSNAGYATYYNGYQQQSTQPYPQQPPLPPSGVHQNTGALYQPLSSFQNTGSYAVPASYSSTYYNPGDYQTSSGSYTPTGAYNNNQSANVWHEGQYAAYASSHQYPSYDSTTTAPAAAASQYQQQYNKQWADYYNHTQSDVTCVPGTENISASNVSSVSCPVPAGYSTSGVQALASYTPSGKPETDLSELSAVWVSPLHVVP